MDLISDGSALRDAHMWRGTGIAGKKWTLLFMQANA